MDRLDFVEEIIRKYTRQLVRRGAWYGFASTYKLVDDTVHMFATGAVSDLWGQLLRFRAMCHARDTLFSAAGYSKLLFV